jgi:hypothetical protein
MSPAEEKRIREEVRKAALTDDGMSRLLDYMFGHGNYTYDPDADVWVVPDADYAGDGRGLIVIRRGGSWYKAVIPEGVLQ